MILDRKGRIEKGRKLLGLSGSRPGFLSIGVMAATLGEEGTVPEVREELMIAMMSVLSQGEAVLDQCRWNGVQWAGCEVDIVEVVSVIGSCQDGKDGAACVYICGCSGPP